VIEDIHGDWKPIAAMYNAGDCCWNAATPNSDFHWRVRFPIKSTIKIAFQNKKDPTLIYLQTYTAFNCLKARILEEEWADIFNTDKETYEQTRGKGEVNLLLPMFVVKDGSDGKFGGCPFRLSSAELYNDLEFLFDPSHEICLEND
jgi:hypothetical protein